MVTGVGIGLIEISLYLYISFELRNNFRSLQNINIIVLWLLMTVLTGIWEFTFK